MLHVSTKNQSTSATCKEHHAMNVQANWWFPDRLGSKSTEESLSESQTNLRSSARMSVSFHVAATGDGRFHVPSATTAVTWLAQCTEPRSQPV